MQELSKLIRQIKLSPAVLQDILVAACIFCIMFLLIKNVKRFILSRFVSNAGHRDFRFRQSIYEILDGTFTFSIIIVSLAISTYFVALPKAGTKFISHVLLITLILQSSYWISILVGRSLNQVYIKKAQSDPSGATAMGLISFLANIMIWIVALLLILDNLGINITALVAGLGIGGVAIALAVQNILGDLMASLSIVFDKPFVVGDSIAVGDFQGTIESIGIKTTRVRSLSGEQVIFSNSDLLGSRIRNFKRLRERRVNFTIGVTYQTPLEKVRSLADKLGEIVRKHDKVRFDRAHFKAFGDSALIFEVVYFVQDSEYNLFMDIQQAINLKVLEYFSSEQIDFAYPTKTLFLQSGTDAKKLEVNLI